MEIYNIVFNMFLKLANLNTNQERKIESFNAFINTTFDI